MAKIRLNQNRRIKLIGKYISNFYGTNPITQKSLLDDLKVFKNAILSKLTNKKVYAIILPVNKKFTEIPEWHHLKGLRYVDHPIYGTHPFYRTFDEVRGWGETRL